MDVEKERERIAKFIKAGLFGLSFVVLASCIFIYIPRAVSTFHQDAKTKEMPIRSVCCNEKKVALSFDVSGSEKKVEEILDTLDEQGIPATFFMTGDWIQEHPKAVRKIYEAGHDIGNHSQNHKEMEVLSKEECVRQIKEVHKLVKDMLGVDMNLFRAPYGEFGENILDASRQLGYYPIQWNVDSKDWKDYGTAAIVNEICNNQELKEGSIVLCHTSTKFTKKALNKIVLALQKRGYSFEKVSDMIYKYDYHLNKDGRQIQNS